MSAYTLLNAVTAAGAGTSQTGLALFDRFTAYYKIASATTGATVQLESQSIDATWSLIDQRTLNSSTTSAVVAFDGPFSTIRASVSSYTDGTITVGLDAKTSR